jgi:tRNA (guanine-N7-)-methyltransferase
MTETTSLPGDLPAKPDGSIPFRRTIKSYVLRAGRTTLAQAKAYETVGPKYLLPYTAEPMDFARVFDRQAPTVLEIGFGMGEATAHTLQAFCQTPISCAAKFTSPALEHC